VLYSPVVTDSLEELTASVVTVSVRLCKMSVSLVQITQCSILVDNHFYDTYFSNVSLYIMRLVQL
jgi:hypothetical protein